VLRVRTTTLCFRWTGRTTVAMRQPLAAGQPDGVTIGASVIVSCDASSPDGFVEEASGSGFRLAYSSTGVADSPPADAFVTFPVHRVGRVHEVVDHPSICPKVMSEFLYDHREAGTCQHVCRRCHDAVDALVS
jgi:hypothetical protein